MKTSLLKAFLLISFLFVTGVYTQVVAGKIELDNSSTTTASNIANPVTFHHTHFSQFFLGGPTVQTSFGSSSLSNHFGDARVSLFSLSDYGITNENIGQLGSLLQIQISVGGTAFGFAGGSFTLFLIDPNTLQIVNIGSEGVSSGPAAIFTVSDFGSLPQNITPDFYIGVRGFVSVISSGGQSTITIRSTVPTPEPASLVLLASGLSGVLLGMRRRRKQKSEPKNPGALK